MAALPMALLQLSVLLLVAVTTIAPVAWALSSPATTTVPKFVILGGTGKIGTSVANHLLNRSPTCEVVLVGRRGGDAAIQEIVDGTKNSDTRRRQRISFQQVDDIWDANCLAPLLQSSHGVSAVIHTAGPYLDETPTVLEAVIAARIPVYVDVSDPLPFLQASLDQLEAARTSQTSALCAAGAFPGMSNVLAMEAAAAAKENADETIQDVRFNYFTKGLGGSGTINLYITNIGFGEPMIQHDQGSRRELTELSGKLLGQVDFFLPPNGSDDTDDNNQQAQQRVGRQQVFAWPFPEAATVASELQIKGSSSAAMGTAPDLWNVMLGLLVNIVPRPWWRSKAFSKFMADFSQPLVLLTDAILRQTTTSDADVGETHAMRIDVTTTTTKQEMTSIVQAHESFRQCVGQSCAEFCLDLLEHPSPGVFLPEQRYRDARDRRRIIAKLTSTPGTFCYTGPVKLSSSSTSFPTDIDQVVAQAKQEQVEL